MAQRSRKKRRPSHGGAKSTQATAVAPVAPKATGGAKASAAKLGTSQAESQDWVTRYSARAEIRNAEARAKLVPLASGERPWPILLSIVLTTIAACVNFALYLAGSKIDGKVPGAGEMIIFTVIMLGCAYGMWVLWFQAVLAFMVLLGIVLVLFAGLLLEASNVLGIVVAIGVLGAGGTLFWKLVGTLSRLQMPERPAPRKR